MKISFRIDCPHCRWGYPWNNNDVNMGWIYAHCKHCDKKFWFRITINDIKIETKK